jgi:hypothetical protein
MALDTTAQRVLRMNTQTGEIQALEWNQARRRFEPLTVIPAAAKWADYASKVASDVEMEREVGETIRREEEARLAPCLRTGKSREDCRWEDLLAQRRKKP